MRLVVRGAPSGDGSLRFEAVAHQDRRVVAQATLTGALLTDTPRRELPLEDVDGVAVPPTGSLEVNPLENADYVLTATGDQGPVSK